MYAISFLEFGWTPTIRHADGSEELYDHENDPQEWTNLATREDLVKVRDALAKWLPQVNAPNAASAVPRGKKRNN